MCQHMNIVVGVEVNVHVTRRWRSSSLFRSSNRIFSEVPVSVLRSFSEAQNDNTVISEYLCIILMACATTVQYIQITVISSDTAGVILLCRNQRKWEMLCFILNLESSYRDITDISRVRIKFWVFWVPSQISHITHSGEILNLDYTEDSLNLKNIKKADMLESNVMNVLKKIQ